MKRTRWLKRVFWPEPRCLRLHSSPHTSPRHMIEADGLTKPPAISPRSERSPLRYSRRNHRLSGERRGQRREPCDASRGDHPGDARHDSHRGPRYQGRPARGETRQTRFFSDETPPIRITSPSLRTSESPRAYTRSPLPPRAPRPARRAGDARQADQPARRTSRGMKQKSRARRGFLTRTAREFFEGR